jgi:hypothetical protein
MYYGRSIGRQIHFLKSYGADAAYDVKFEMDGKITLYGELFATVSWNDYDTPIFKFVSPALNLNQIDLKNQTVERECEDLYWNMTPEAMRWLHCISEVRSSFSLCGAARDLPAGIQELQSLKLLLAEEEYGDGFVEASNGKEYFSKKCTFQISPTGRSLLVWRRAEAQQARLGITDVK